MYTGSYITAYFLRRGVVQAAINLPAASRGAYITVEGVIYDNISISRIQTEDKSESACLAAQ